MRVLMVLLALVAMPLVAGVAQEEPSDNPGVRHAWARGHDKDNRCDNDERSDARRADRKDSDHDRQCAAPVDPPPSTPPPSPTPPPSACTPTTFPSGGATISGMVYNGLYSGTGLSCWTVTVSDGTTTLTTVTDVNGNYSVTVPATAGVTYTVCEVVQSGWHQTWPIAGFPSCGLAGWGYAFPLTVGGSAAGVSFGNAVGP